MAPNLALIHLESLNNLIYRLHPEWFPTIREIEKEGVFFSNYYSTATSTIMVLSDLFYGTTDILEEQYNLTDVKQAVKIKNAIKDMELKKVSLFDSLQAQEYKIKNYLLWGHYDVAYLSRLLAHDCEFVNTNNHETLRKEVEKFFAVDRPFALFLDDCSSAMDFLGDNRHLKKGLDLKAQGFIEIDTTIKIIVEVLKACKKYENTVFVLYGDHGDDFWEHGLSDGYSHALPPYQHMIHVPLIISGVKKNQPVLDYLIGTSDLKQLIHKLLEHPTDEIDAICKPSDVVFSRNLFANQELRTDSFNKSYSVTDGKYLLLVSHYGLELYLNCFDVNSFCNILNFFILTDDRISFCKQLRFTKSSHFNSFWTEPQIAEVQEVFQKLVRLLQDEVKRKYEKIERDYQEMKFHKIHYTERCRCEKKYYIRRLSRTVRQRLVIIKKVCFKQFTERK